MPSKGRFGRRLRDALIYRLVSGRRSRPSVFRYLRDSGVEIAREVDGIRLIAHADKIGQKLAQGSLWQRAEFDETIRLLRGQKKLPPGGVFVDVGANIGMHSIYAAKSGLFPRVIAVEPLAANFRLVQANVALNKVDMVTAVRCAAGAGTGEARLFRNPGNFGKSSLANDPGAGFETVPVKTLDGILKDCSVKPQDVRLVWIDVEGAEAQVLAGMGALLRRRTPLAMEFSPDYLKQDLEGLVRTLCETYNSCFVLGKEPLQEIGLTQLRSVTDQIDIVVI